MFACYLQSSNEKNNKKVQKNNARLSRLLLIYFSQILKRLLNFLKFNNYILILNKLVIFIMI